MHSHTWNRRGRLALFLLLTFGLSWGFDLIIAVTIGHADYLVLGLSPWSMFVPAAVAFTLQVFVWRDSPLHYRRGLQRPLLIPLSFLLLTVLYALVTGLAIAYPQQRSSLGGLGNLLTTLWTLAIFSLYGQLGAAGFARVGLPLGQVGQGFKIGLGVVLFMLSQFALNLLFNLGDFRGLQETVYGLAVPAGWYPLFLLLAFLLAVSGTPLAGLAATFGEEYGWRGVLLSAWQRIGRPQAALLAGLVWGVWHFPVVLSGIHTYPPTAIGFGLGLVFFALWGLVQGYAVYKTGSLWVAAFLHGLVNSLYAFGLTYLVRPENMLWSFGMGIFGLLCLAGVVLLLLRDPVWRAAERQDPTGLSASGLAG